MSFGEESFVGKAIEFKSEIIALSPQPWASTNKKAELVPGRIMIINYGSNVTCHIVLFETGAVIYEKLTELHIIPEIITDDEHYVISSDIKYHIKDDHFHCDNGPAIEGIKTNKEDKFYLNGVRYSAEDYLDTLSEDKQTAMLFHLDKLNKNK